MVLPLALAVAVVALVIAAAAAFLAARDRRPGKPLLQGLLALQVLLLVQAAVAVVRLVGGDSPEDSGAFLGYLIVSVLLAPGAMIWSFEEKTRYGTLVLAVACLVVAVLQQRLGSIWATV